MLQLKTGVQLKTLRQPLKKALQTASKLGFDAVEIDGRSELPTSEMGRTATRHLRKMLEDLNLQVCSLSFPTRRGFGVAEKLEQRIEATKNAMSLAYELGARVLTNQVGEIPQADDDNPLWSMLLESLTSIGKHGQKCGVVFAARTGAEPGSELKRLMSALPTGSIGIDFDPGELTINKFSPSEAIQLLGDSVVHVRARDAVQDLAQGRGLEVQLGRGSVDFPEILAELENHAYDGYFTMERRFAQDPQLELSQGLEFLKNLWM